MLGGPTGQAWGDGHGLLGLHEGASKPTRQRRARPQKGTSSFLPCELYVELGEKASD